MGISSQTKFIKSFRSDNAIAHLEMNLTKKEWKTWIEIGEKVLTIETLIHEINELEISILLNQIGKEENNGVNDWSRINEESISHILSPYGKGSLIDGYSDINAQIKKEHSLIGE